MIKPIGFGTEGIVYDIGKNLVKKRFLPNHINKEKHTKCVLLSNLKEKNIAFPINVEKKYSKFNSYIMPKVDINKIDIFECDLENKTKYLIKLNKLLTNLHKTKINSTGEEINIIHCDIKYSNFPIDKNGEVWCLDTDNAMVNEIIPVHLNRFVCYYVVNLRQMISKNSDMFLLGIFSISLITGIPEKQLLLNMKKDSIYLHKLIEQINIPTLLKEYYTYLFYSRDEKDYLPTELIEISSKQKIIKSC